MRSVKFALGTILLACTEWTPAVTAATKAEEVIAVENGLAYLSRAQQPGGYWGPTGFEQGATGAAAFAFLSQQNKWGSHTGPYQAAVQGALTYLLSTATVIDVTTRDDGVNVCPEGTSTCKGVYWLGDSEPIYTTGLVAPVIAAYGLKAGAGMVATTRGPLAGMTWGQIAQAITNAVAAGQTNGGWHHFPAKGEAGSSTTQWAVTAFLYDETLGAATPEVVKHDLKGWLTSVQNASGAACFQLGTEPCDQADTGGWLLAMKFVGYERTDPQVQAALSFLNTYWRSTPTNLWYGNFGNPYAMWAVYKGLETTIGLDDTSQITHLFADCPATANDLRGELSGAPCSWSEDYKRWLIKNQNADGKWAGYGYWPDAIATAFYINVVGASRIPMAPKSRTPEPSQPAPDRDQAALAIGNRASLAAPVAAAQPAQPGNSSKKVHPHAPKGVTALAVNADGSALASASTDNKVRIWSATTGLQQVIVQGSLGSPTSLAFNPLSNNLSGGARDSLGRVWDAASGSELARFAGHEHAIRSVAISPDGKLLGSAGEETRIMLWDLVSRKLKAILRGPTDFVSALAFSPDSRSLASAGDDARVLIFDVATSQLRFTLRGHSGPINSVAFSPDGTVLASGGQDTVIHVWDPALGQQRQALAGHSAPIRSIAFSPDSRLMASGGEDTRILLWNAATGVLQKTLTGATGMINVLVFDPKGRFLGSASDDGTIAIWNVTTGKILLTITVPVAP